MRATLTTAKAKADRQRLLDIRYHWAPIRLRTTTRPKSHIFSRCKFCGTLAIRGICQSPTCGHASVCSYCKKVRQPDGTFQHIPREIGTRESHGICRPCYDAFVRDELATLKAA